ncbi:septum formation initiator family protein [Porphyromonas sp.]|uniref:FtsB family cell division protein n=1 Tax=Porphyromonas sp. TaxID=1924944 RepID=UPI0026DB384C|nr:hypothetical protein [Porphyromonas sp.]MDO4695784.1 hypothetical protein [Porphyromonas sp.]MDO4771538.1 hypothetical protein [Porphyromonas sp.]
MKKDNIINIFNRIKALNPFVVMAVIGLLLLLYPSDDSIFSQIEYSSQLKSMIKERDRLKKKIEEDHIKLDQLRFKREKLEKYARERFLMKAEDEDLYILKD